MTSTEVVWVPKQEIEILYGPHEPTRRERREAKSLRRWKRTMILGPALAFVTGCGLIAWYQPPGAANAQETQATTTSTVPPQPPAVATPETIPPKPMPGWTTYAVETPTWQGLGRLLTENPRIIPGDKGEAIISIDHDPEPNAATMNVNGVTWRIRERGTAPADNLSQFLKRPDVPVVVVISEKPTAMRSYVEMVRA